MEDRPRTVFILGAGASVHAGAPVMSNFLDVAEDIYFSGTLEAGDKAQFAAVFEGIHRLQGTLAKAQMDLNNIESVFAAFEMGELLGILEPKDGQPRLTDAIRRLIVVTLERSIQFPLPNGEIQPRPTCGYDRLAKLVKAMRTQFSQQFSIITFNYDAVLNYALFCNAEKIQDCLDGAAAQENVVRLLKLHGSLHWAIKKQANGRFVIPRDLVFSYSPDCAWSREQNGQVMMRLGTDVASFKPEPSISGTVEGLPLIVPPTSSKYQHHWQIRNVWKAAAQDLGQANRIFVIGYSLPETDQFFRYLFALGTMGKTRIRDFVVFDPTAQDSGPLVARFRALLGRLSTDRFEAFPCKFEEAIGHIEKILTRT